MATYSPGDVIYRISSPKWKSGALGKVYEVELERPLKGVRLYLAWFTLSYQIEAKEFASGEMIISGSVC